MSTLPLRAERPVGASWYDPEDAPARFDLRACIHCGLCLTACPTYRELGIEPDSPRGRIYLMRGLAEGRIAPSHPLLHHIDLCLGCRACETVCPAGVRYGRLLDAARGQLRRRAAPPTPLRVLGEWALHSILPHRERMHLAADLLRLGQRGPLAAFMRSGFARRALPAFATRGFALTPPLESRRERGLERVAGLLPAGARAEVGADALLFHPAGPARARVGFFTSCVMEVMFPAINRETVRLLVLAGCQVSVPRAQTCCGALQAHSGLRRVAMGLARQNVRAFEDGCDYIVTNSAGCGAALCETGHLLRDEPSAERAGAFAGRVRDVSEVLAEVALPEPRTRLASERDPSRPLRVGYHDPCHLAHAQGVRSEPRALLKRIPGLELVDVPDSDWCCGSAGIYNLTHPGMADAQLGRRLDSIEQISPELVVASNPGCMLHLARGAAERGMTARIVHLIEILARAHPAAARTENRAAP